MKLYFSRDQWPDIQSKFVKEGFSNVPYNGKLLTWGPMGACVEFNSKEDATMFKLVYGYVCSNN